MNLSSVQPAPVQTVIAGTDNPSTTPAGGQSQVTGSVTDPTGAGTPTGTVGLNVSLCRQQACLILPDHRLLGGVVVR